VIVVLLLLLYPTTLLMLLLFLIDDHLQNKLKSSTFQTGYIGQGCSSSKYPSIDGVRFL